jgi:hypothetical protein
MINEKLQAAVGYARRGWKVFPLHHILDGRCSCGDRQCHSPGKHPVITKRDGGRGLDDATSDEVLIERWWNAYPNANIGITTGQFSNLFVIDIDGESGSQSWSELTDAYGPPTCNCSAKTGSGGMHLLFSYPSGFEIGNSAGKLGKGIDTRGNRGYIVAPPSNHISGGNYEWIEHGEHLHYPPVWVTGILHAPELPTTRPEWKKNGKSGDPEVFWLNKAIARAVPGNRNFIGFWLATQLRDAGVSQQDAVAPMQKYMESVTSMASPPYTWSEAIASLQSAYKTPPREGAVSRSRPSDIEVAESHIKWWSEEIDKMDKIVRPKQKQPTDVAEELRGWMEGVESGRIQNVPWPHPIFTHMTQALLPGSLVTVVGDPGVGKTFWVTDNLVNWDEQGVSYGALFLEKNRRFYAQRILAQLAGDGRITTYTDIARHPEVWREALREHQHTLKRIGANVVTRERGVTYTPKVVGRLIRKMAEDGKRVIVVDPVTAMIKGREPWNEEQWFVQDECQSIAEDHGCSIVFVTHPVKERPVKGQVSGHSAAGGAAWFRFVDTQIWLQREDPPEEYRIQTLNNGVNNLRGDVIATAIKTRDGSGAGRRFLFDFRRLRYQELGIILGVTGDGDSRRELSQEEIGQEPSDGSDYFK